MLNRRILRVKAFKVLYACAENQDLSLKDALKELECSLEAARDLYVYLLGVIPALTAEASRRIEAAREKFNPSQEELNPSMKFVNNSFAAILNDDPDYHRLIEKKHFSWDQNDSLVHSLWETIRSRQYYQDYMASAKSSAKEDAALWKAVFTEELEDNEALLATLEDISLYWGADDLGYVLGFALKAFDRMARTGRWEFPPLYQSDILSADGKDVSSDSEFVKKLLTVAYGRREEYAALISSSVSKWDLDRICTSDIVLVSLGLSEARTFPDIPLKVSINEYVEIAKYYSTPRSSGFVNGLLDRLAHGMEERGEIVKNN
ncbi:MAG: transcription antitermination protein NusB [Bacteroidales bacterium]|nr:transcription antitermination protein NusB [Bacteroidales bacterium]